jgi:hypothetical protein
MLLDPKLVEAGKITAKHFQPATMVAIGENASWQTGVEADADQVIARVYEILGIQEDTFGIQESSNQFQAKRWVGFAFKTLKRKELGCSGRRNQWGLTESGLKQAKNIATQAGLISDEIEEIPVQTPTLETKAKEILPVLKSEAVETTVVGWSPLKAIQEDAHLQALLVGNTRCFGHHSKRAPSCKSCPVTQLCEQNRYANWAAINERLIFEEKQPVYQPAEEATEDLAKGLDNQIKVAEETSEEPTSNENFVAGALKITMQANGICIKCKGSITRGTKAWYAQSHGVYHLSCPV